VALASGQAAPWESAYYASLGRLEPRRRTLLAAVALLIAAGAVTGIVAALTGGPAVPAADENHPGDVLLVRGYGGSTGALDVLAVRISAAGGRPIVVHLAGDGTGDLQVQAYVLNEYVNQALAAGSGPVTVIGYSAGGVVAWLWDVDYDGPAKARRIITLGSPLHGAAIAAVGVASLPGQCPVAREASSGR
jgi:triacylglycerol lipase